MATSNSYNFAVTRDEIINLAHQHIGAVGEGEDASTAQVTEAAKLLNMIVKLRAADGMPVWSLKRATILPTTGVSSVETDSHIVSFYAQSTISAAEAALQTVLSITSTTNFTGGDQIGIELDSGIMHWTTIVTVDSATQVTVTTAIPTAAAAGNVVYAYTASADRIQKPLRILEVNINDVVSGSRHEITQVSRQEFFALGSLTTASIPNQLYYDLGSNSDANLDDGSIYVYPRFAGGNNVIEFTYHRPFQDFDASTDNPDFPQAFFLPLMLELAFLLSSKFGLPIEMRREIAAEAAFYREEALSTAYPEGSLRLIPDIRFS